MTSGTREAANVELQRLLAAAEERARRAESETEAVSYAISHDLRAPLRAVEGFAAAAAEAADREEHDDVRTHLERVRSAAARMTGQLDGLTQYSRVTRRVLEPRRLDMAGIAREVAEATGSAAIEVGPLPDVEADEVLVRDLLARLIDNASKATAGSGAPRIDVAAEPGDPPVFVVRDNGMGFDPAHAQRMFDLYQRLHRPEDFPGLGVGLAVAARITGRHGGTIWADSAPGAGAILRFTLAPAAQGS